MIGDSLEFSLRNDILGYVKRDLTGDIGTKLPVIPKKCPFCGEPTIYSKTEVFLLCSNNECEGRTVEMINQYTSTMKMKGIEVSTIKILFEAGIVRSIKDLYDIESHKKKIVKLAGFGELSYNNLVETIFSRSTPESYPYDYEILASVGIEGIGITLAKEIAGKFDIEDELLNCENSKLLHMQLKKIEGFADIRANNLINGIDDNFDLLQFLYTEAYPNYKRFADQVASVKRDDVSYTIVVTGELEGISRPEFEAKMKLRGHKVVGSVSSKTSFLITNDPTTGTAKNQKASSLGIPILTQAQFMKKIGD
jgi:DNA ligase (NAD+)